MDREARRRAGVGLIGIIIWLIMAVLLIKLFFIVGAFAAFATYVLVVQSFTISLIVGGIAGLIVVGLVWLILDGLDALFDGVLHLLTGRKPK